MSEWQSIGTAPKDGTVIWARRVHEGRVVAEGEAEWGVAAFAAPIREPMIADPLGRMTDAQYAEEAVAMKNRADTPRWMRKGRMYAFPEPTEWMPPNPSA